MEKLWHNLVDNSGVAIDNTSVLIIESVKSTLIDRSHWAELLFNTFHVPSICFGNSASLSVLASGRTTGVAVEVGSGITATVPVFEGLVLKHATVTMEHAGQDISINLRRLFNERNIQIDLNSAKIIKEKLAHTQGYRNKDLDHTVKEYVSFCLPDGNDVNVETKVFRDSTDSLFVNNKIATGGLVSQLHESIILCDDSLKRDLTQNIITSGGTSMIPGFGDRLYAETVAKFQAETDPKLSSLSQLVRVVPTSSYRYCLCCVC
jgi:actin